MVGVAMLDGHLDGFLERDGALDVPAIEAVPAADSLIGVGDVRSVVWVGEALTAEIPCAVVVVLGAGAVDGGQFVAVDEDHVVAFAEPAVLVLQYGLGDADKMAAARRFHEDIIACAIEILLVANRVVAVGLPVVCPSLVRSSLAILRVE